MNDDRNQACVRGAQWYDFDSEILKSGKFVSGNKNALVERPSKTLHSTPFTPWPCNWHLWAKRLYSPQVQKCQNNYCIRYRKFISMPSGPKPPFNPIFSTFISFLYLIGAILDVFVQLFKTQTLMCQFKRPTMRSNFLNVRKFTYVRPKLRRSAMN